jgi:hypothetical protein
MANKQQQMRTEPKQLENLYASFIAFILVAIKIYKIKKKKKRKEKNKEPNITKEKEIKLNKKYTHSKHTNTHTQK